VNDPVRDLHEFLAHMGITADVRPDDVNDHPLIIIETEQYHQFRGWLEAWFTLVEESPGYCYFRERKRGTGDTK
jgi:hypothetical protein